jgi:hypothetical protein
LAGRLDVGVVRAVEEQEVQADSLGR